MDDVKVGEINEQILQDHGFTKVNVEVMEENESDNSMYYYEYDLGGNMSLCSNLDMNEVWLENGDIPSIKWTNIHDVKSLIELIEIGLT